MAYSFCEPLSAVDAAFLAVEDSKAHMHIGAVTIFEAAKLQRPEGGLDIDRIRAFVGSQLHRVPRFRQKLAFVPVSGRPVWIDDPSFNLTYHVRHTGLPFPGDAQKLKDLTGRIMSQELERAKPLWELWFVEGLEGDRFAIISKIHHALADGISGLDLIAADRRAQSRLPAEAVARLDAPPRPDGSGDALRGRRPATLPAGAHPRPPRRAGECGAGPRAGSPTFPRRCARPPAPSRPRSRRRPRRR